MTQRLRQPLAVWKSLLFPHVRATARHTLRLGGWLAAARHLLARARPKPTWGVLRPFARSHAFQRAHFAEQKSDRGLTPVRSTKGAIHG